MSDLGDDSDSCRVSRDSALSNLISVSHEGLRKLWASCGRLTLE